MSVGGRPGKKSKPVSIRFDLNRFGEILLVVSLENCLSKTSGENFSANIIQSTEFEMKKNVKAASFFSQRNKHIFKKISQADVVCSKDKYADDVSTDYPEEVSVSEIRIEVREELLEGDNDKYLDNEMLEPCVSEEEVSEDEGQEQKINYHAKGLQC